MTTPPNDPAHAARQEAADKVFRAAAEIAGIIAASPHDDDLSVEAVGALARWHVNECARATPRPDAEPVGGERAEFEKWWRAGSALPNATQAIPRFGVEAEPDYSNSLIAWAWSAWQARAALARAKGV